MKKRKLVLLFFLTMLVAIVGIGLAEVFFISYFEIEIVKNAEKIFIVTLALILAFFVKFIFDLKIINRTSSLEKKEFLKEERELVVDALYLCINLSINFSIIVAIIGIEKMGISKKIVDSSAPYGGLILGILLTCIMMLLGIKSDKAKKITKN